MTNIEFINTLLGSGGILGVAVIVFKLGRSAEKIDYISDKINKLIENNDNKLSAILSEIKECNKKLNETHDRLTRLEVRVEERTLKVYHVERNGTEIGSYRG